MGWELDHLPGVVSDTNAAFAIGFFMGFACAVTLAVLVGIFWWWL